MLSCSRPSRKKDAGGWMCCHCHPYTRNPTASSNQSQHSALNASLVRHAIYARIALHFPNLCRKSSHVNALLCTVQSLTNNVTFWPPSIKNEVLWTVQKKLFMLRNKYCKVATDLLVFLYILNKMWHKCVENTFLPSKIWGFAKISQVCFLMVTKIVL